MDTKTRYETRYYRVQTVTHANMSKHRGYMGTWVPKRPPRSLLTWVPSFMDYEAEIIKLKKQVKKLQKRCRDLEAPIETHVIGFEYPHEYEDPVWSEDDE